MNEKVAEQEHRADRSQPFRPVTICTSGAAGSGGSCSALAVVVRILISVVLFIVSLMAMAVVCTVAWDSCLNGKVYDCTDGGSLDFWFVGDWVHHPVTVDHVVSGRSMSEPDTIKSGWSMSRLWCLWYSFVAGSVLVSASVAFLPWIRKRHRGDLGS